MRGKSLVGTLAVSALLAGSPSVSAPLKGDSKAPADSSAGLAEAAGLADRAAESLFAVGASDDQIKQGLLTLLEAASAAAPASRIPGDWPATLKAAARLIREGSPTDAQAAMMLGDCYRKVTGGKTFRIPADFRSLDQVTAYARGRLDSARADLKLGKAADGVRGLLETALTIVTPVER